MIRPIRPIDFWMDERQTRYVFFTLPALELDRIIDREIWKYRNSNINNKTNINNI